MKVIYLIMLVGRETKNETILFAVDGTLKQAANRMMEYVEGNDINTDTYYCYVKKVNCYID